MARKRSQAQQAFLVAAEWLGIGLGLALFSCLTHRALVAICDFLSAVAYRFDRRGRVRSLDNLRILTGASRRDEYAAEFDPDTAPYDPSPRERLIIRRSYRNMARTLGHVFWTCWRARRRVAAVGEMSPEAAAFLAAHRPAVTVSAHLGCWEILSQLALLNGHDMMSVAKHIGTDGMTRLLMRSRKSIGQEIVPAEGAFRPLMDGIRRGKSLGLLVDQAVRPQDGGVWVRFLGRAMSVSAAPAFFAAKARAAIIVAWSRPLKDGRYRCEKIDEIGVGEARDIWATTQRCATDIARVVRRHPSCWILNYNYFSNRPDEADLAQLAKREGTPFAPRLPREVAVDFSGGDVAKLQAAVQAVAKSRADLSPVTIVVRGPADDRLRALFGKAAATVINLRIRFEDGGRTEA